MDVPVKLRTASPVASTINIITLITTLRDHDDDASMMLSSALGIWLTPSQLAISIVYSSSIRHWLWPACRAAWVAEPVATSDKRHADCRSTGIRGGSQRSAPCLPCLFPAPPPPTSSLPLHLPCQLLSRLQQSLGMFTHARFSGSNTVSLVQDCYSHGCNTANLDISIRNKIYFKQGPAYSRANFSK